MNENLEHIKSAVIGGKHNEIEGLVEKAIQNGADLDQIVNDTFASAMEIVGKKYTDGEVFVPEMLVAAVTMKKGLEIIKPLLNVAELESKGTVLMGTVKGDLHDVGKNLVIMMLEAAGFHVIDLGVDVSRENFVQQVQEVTPDILGLSALLTTTMPEMKNVIEALEEKRLRNTVKVMVGGAPIDARFAEKICADGYGKDAAEAVQLSKTLIAPK